MKLKSRPGDFIVEERLDWPLLRRGRFTVYRVEKAGITTFDLMDEMAKGLGVERWKLSHAGLKDKYAQAVQFIAYEGEGPLDLAGTNWQARWEGALNQPLGADAIAANDFTLIIRDLLPAEADGLRAALTQLGKSGWPNYYDDQRLAAGRAGAFMARHILRRESEAALKSYLAPSGPDRSAVRDRRVFFQENWGKFKKCLERAETEEEIAIFTPLSKDRQAYSAALNAIPRELLFLQVTAYQALLWNRLAAAGLEAFPASAHLENRAGRLPLPDKLPAEFERIFLPLPGKGAIYPPPFDAAAEKLFEEEGISAKQFKVDKINHAHFKPSPRRLIVRPEALATAPPRPDEFDSGRRSLELRLTLPAGCYATLLIKAASALASAG